MSVDKDNHVNKLIEAAKKLHAAPGEDLERLWREHAECFVAFLAFCPIDQVARNLVTVAEKAAHYTAHVAAERDSRHKEETNRYKEEINRHKEENTRHQEEITRQKEEITRHKEEITRNKEEITRREKEIARVLPTLLHTTIYSCYGTRRQDLRLFPRIKYNFSVTPSINSTEQQGQEIREAEIKDCSNGAWLDESGLRKIKIPVLNDDGSFMTSLIGTALSPCEDGLFAYSNELDFHHLCKLLVDDAIMSLGLVGTVKSRMELSLYSLIPDIVIVEVGGRMVFVIEVKSPELKKGEVFTSTYVAGQIWCYLMAMRQHGCKRPMGAIMTFDKIRLVSLEDLGKNDQHLTDLQEVTSLDHRVKMIPGPVTVNKSQTSPSRKPEKVMESNRKIVPSTAADNDDIEHDSTIYCSGVYEGNTVFPALLQGILVAYRAGSSSVILKTLPTVRHGDDLGGRLLALMSKPRVRDETLMPSCSLRFVTSKAKLQANEHDLPSPRSNDFYMLGRLGSGNQGSCYVACNSSGRMCCVKLYLPKPPRDALAKDREENWNRQIDALSRIAAEEAKRWREIYSYGNCVHDTMLGGVPALIMPYGHEVDINERQSALPHVGRVLHAFADKGYSYEHEDLRWRHVLKDHEGKIFLADLGSLTQVATEETDASVVEKQIEQLQHRMGTDPTGQATTNKAPATPERPSKKRKT